MNPGMLETTSIPILEQVVQFTEARHTVLAGNIANMDTPGYKARDLSVEDFQKRLGEAIDARRQPLAPQPQTAVEELFGSEYVSPGDLVSGDLVSGDFVSPGDVLSPEMLLQSAPAARAERPKPLLAEVAKNTKSILLHDQSNVGMEQQVSEMVKNQMRHNLALNIMVKQFQTLSTAISGRV